MSVDEFMIIMCFTMVGMLGVGYGNNGMDAMDGSRWSVDAVNLSVF